MRFFRRPWVIAVTAIVLAAGIGGALFFWLKPSASREIVAPTRPEAPPDLAKLQPKFSAALDAMRRGDPASAGDAIAIIPSLTSLPPTAPITALTAGQRLERAVSLLRDGSPDNAVAELNTFPLTGEFAPLRLPIELNRGLALNQLRRYDDS